jgi:uncharacterized damage-inducible protein DinB
MNPDKVLRENLINLLSSRQAHVDLETALTDFPPALRGKRPEGAAHTAWQLLEHIRLAQWDILQFSLDPEHVSPEFPAGYWPQKELPPDEAAWAGSVSQFQADLKAMVDLVSDPSTDLYSPIPHGTGQTILREALLVADHNAYHLGQLVVVRRLLDERPG